MEEKISFVKLDKNYYETLKKYDPDGVMNLTKELYIERVLCHFYKKVKISAIIRQNARKTH